MARKLRYPLIINSLLSIAGGIQTLRLKLASGRPRLAAENTLRDILKISQNTFYGRTHHFEHILSAPTSEELFSLYQHLVPANDYEALRGLFCELLKEVQRIKSEGDVEAARQLVETYGVKVDPELHKEVLARYKALNIAPYKGFINPVYTPVTDKKGNITDVKVSYTEGYAEQHLRYSRDYHFLPYVND